MLDEETSLVPKNGATSDTTCSNGPSRRYPDAFYDPKTGKLMGDPVVAPGGISYERSSWEHICESEEIPSAPAYDNRALKQVIEETLLETDTTVISTRKSTGTSSRRDSGTTMLLKVHHSARKSMRGLVEKSILPSDDHKPLSDAYYCPITMMLMQHPVIGPEGFTFEKEAIEHWVDENQVSPLTRTPLPSKELLYPNLALKHLLQLEADKADEEDSDPSIRDFKLALLETPQDHQEQTSEYTGPRTMEEWQTLRNQRRQSNAQTDAEGFIYFAILIFFLVLYLAIYILLAMWLGWAFILGCCLAEHGGDVYRCLFAAPTEQEEEDDQV
ncbi:SAM and U-box domain-containing protein 1 [Seminavis robusta]|uniref:SAM and U-box domain-containing protein 1 n=1 Tax=Seminavis robusta TaxID=568900 RepID=A0A9N8HCN5_9STRA|nr:SAM and U-box domain-containing protein 1 [Seminavis robusta]|eukprot:Sro226_g092050.1 SAM and U-box domain-containing protein 1 (329) ;mRNA; f:48788-49774